MRPRILRLVFVLSGLIAVSAPAFQIQGQLVRVSSIPVYGEIAADAEHIYATSHPTTQIRVFDRQTLSEIGAILTPATQPGGLVVGNGILFVSDIRPNGDPTALSHIFALTLPAGRMAYSFDAPVAGVIALGLDDQGRLLLAGNDAESECGRLRVYRLDASNGAVLEAADVHLDGVEPIIGWQDGHLVLGDAQGVTRISYFLEGDEGPSFFNRVGELVVPGMPNISYRGSALDGDTLFLTGTFGGPFMGSYALLEVKLSSPLDLVVHVDDDTCPGIGSGKHGDPFCKIQDAIEASPGQTVVVRPGVYLENINFVGSEVTLTSKDPHDSNSVASTIIDGSTASLPSVTFENAETRASVITGFTIVGGTGKVDDFLPAGGGIYCRNSSPTIRDNVIRGNETDLGGGVYIRGGSPLIERNQIVHNVATHSGGGMKVTRSSTAEIRNNLIAGNGAYPPLFGGDGGAIDVFDCPMGAAPTIRNNTIVGSYALVGGSAISCSAASPSITNNIIAFNRIRPAVWGDAASSPTACFNVFWQNLGSDHGGSVVPCASSDQFVDPAFVDAGLWTDPIGTPGDLFDDVWAIGDYHLLPSSPCIDAGNPAISPSITELDLDNELRQTGFRMDIGADELRGVLNLANDLRYPSIQDAIDHASEDDTIVLLPGRYFENLRFEGKNLTLRSLIPTDTAIAQATIINGSQSSNPASGSVITFAGTEDHRTLIDGVTITGGSGTATCSYTRLGGGILGNGSTARLRNCRVVNNFIPSNIPGTLVSAGRREGGGIFDLDGVISDCEISDNRLENDFGSAGAGLANCDGEILDSTVDNNFSGSSGTGRGGGLYFCQANITRCTISNNFASDQGGGLDSCNGIIRDSVISGNFSEDGGGLGQCDATIIGTTFRKNSSECGGAIQNSQGTIDQSAFDENFASNYGGALCGFTGPIRDSEFKDNMTQNGGGAATSSSGPFERCVFDGNIGDFGSAIESRNAIQVLDSVFLNNMAYSGGGAVSFNGQNPLVQVVHNCRFENNEGGAIEVQGHSTPTITRTTFVDNRGDYSGGAITMFGDVDIDDCVFLGNTAVGFDGCCDVPSGAMGGAIANWGRALTIRDSIFAGNVATVLGSNIDFQGGGAIWSDAGSNVEITGSTFFSNVSESVAGAIFQGGGQLSIRNSIFAGNSDSSGSDDTSHIQSVPGNVNLDYSLVLGGWSGTGSDNLDADPHFVDADGPDDLPGTEDDDLRLLPSSPCINRGDPGSTFAPGESDVADNPRLIGCRADLGAYESNGDQALGDFNGDNRIDLQDAALFQMCFDAQIGNPAWATSCLCVFDQDNGGTVDLPDHSAFQAAMTGP